jgi:hypothetical protein
VIKGYVERVEIVYQGEKIATHGRSYEREDFIANPLHYLALLKKKPRALDQAALLDKWLLGEAVHRLRRLMEARSGKEGRKEFIHVLRLYELFDQSLVEWAIAQALDMGAISFDAVRMIVLGRLERKPPKLDLSLYPYLPRATVGSTDTRSYMHLLSMPHTSTFAGAAA